MGLNCPNSLPQMLNYGTSLSKGSVLFSIGLWSLIGTQAICWLNAVPKKNEETPCAPNLAVFQEYLSIKKKKKKKVQGNNKCFLLLKKERTICLICLEWPWRNGKHRVLQEGRQVCVRPNPSLTRVLPPHPSAMTLPALHPGTAPYLLQALGFFPPTY